MTTNSSKKQKEFSLSQTLAITNCVGLNTNDYEKRIACCPTTGIQIEILAPVNSTAYSLSYSNELSIFTKAQTVVSQPISTLQDSSEEYLSGAILSIYKHYNLIVHTDNAVVSNSILRTCKKETLLFALELSKSFTKKNSFDLPQLDIDYNTHKEGVLNFDSSMKEYVKTIKSTLEELGDLLRLSSRGIVKLPTIRASYDINAPENNPAIVRATNTMNKELEEYKNKARVAYKAITTTLVALEYKKLAIVLKAVLASDNIKTTAIDIKEKIVSRLHEVKELVEEIEDKNYVIDIINCIEYSKKKNITVDVSFILSTAIETITESKPKTLAEIIAATKAREALKGVQ